ncbi:MAG: hypothetical protein HY925_01290 [Elusimicrobia bacterium]|nr:hypothetical protein [Elusimicrobiota bacterium]
MKLACLLLALALVAGCQPEGEQAPPPPAAGGGGGGSTGGGGGGGDVSFGNPGGERAGAPSAARNPQIEQRYERAVQKIKDRDFDGAYLELGSLVVENPDSNLAAKAMKDLEQVQTTLLAIPPTPHASLLSAKKFASKPVSVRGAFRPAAPGETETFWLDADGKKVRCRYSRLHAEAKRALATMPPGSKLLARGFWTTGAEPFLDVTLFKIES